jgi:2-haloacid dehalogenase
VDVLFDLNGTLLDPAPLTATWPSAPRGLALSVLDQAVVQAMVDTMTGEFRPFPHYLRAALGHRAAVAGLPLEHVEAGLAAARALPAFADAAGALARLREAGHRVSVLTNSGAHTARDALAQAGLDGLAHTVVSAEEAAAYKPDPRIYGLALERLGAAPERAWLVAAHWWDVTGAKRAGMRTAWVGRDEAVLLETVPAPDVAARDLASAADAIAAAGD